MIIETKFGKFEILKNERDAFDLELFEKRYFPEYFDKYAYIVGDLADELLRLKGFAVDSKSPNYFHYIPEYITEACAYNCKYYVLKRVSEGNNNHNKNKFYKNHKRKDVK